MQIERNLNMAKIWTYIGMAQAHIPRGISAGSEVLHSVKRWCCGKRKPPFVFWREEEKKSYRSLNIRVPSYELARANSSSNINFAICTASVYDYPMQYTNLPYFCKAASLLNSKTGLICQKMDLVACFTSFFLIFNISLMQIKNSCIKNIKFACAILFSFNLTMFIKAQ